MDAPGFGTGAEQPGIAGRAREVHLAGADEAMDMIADGGAQVHGKDMGARSGVRYHPDAVVIGARVMDQAGLIVILSGAGLSAESGLATFRGPGGLWEGHRVEDVCTPEALVADPVLVHRFYDERRAALAGVEPNAAHQALARLERAWPGALLLVTQNVDDLLERAGCARVLHMHGELLSALCAACGWTASHAGDLPPGSNCPACRAPALRPDICFFGEVPRGMDAIEAALARAALFVSIGTSGAVYPAAGFVRAAGAGGAATLELNLERSAGSGWFDQTRLGPATALVPAWVDEVLRD